MMPVNVIIGVLLIIIGTIIFIFGAGQEKKA